MVTRKITDLTEKTTLVDNDLFLITDSSDTSSKSVKSSTLKGLASDNSDVVANTAKRHDSVSTTDSGEIYFTLLSQDIKAELQVGGIVEAKLNTSINASLDLADSSMQDVVDDTTPQLGGNLDLNNKAFTRQETAGESLVAGDLCYIKSDGKYWKADASVNTTCDTDLLLANATISADAIGTFIEYGEYTTTGLTAGAIYYVSETTGDITSTAPTTSTSIVRIVGYAKSTTVLMFKPDITYIEVA